VTLRGSRFIAESISPMIKIVQPSEAKLVEIEGEHLDQLPAVRDLFAKYQGRLSYGGQGQGEGRYRVVIYLDEETPLPLEELRKLSIAGEGREFPVVAFCDLERKSGAILQTRVLV
jgi:hypothetical protein